MEGRISIKVYMDGYDDGITKGEIVGHYNALLDNIANRLTEHGIIIDKSKASAGIDGDNVVFKLSYKAVFLRNFDSNELFRIVMDELRAAVDEENLSDYYVDADVSITLKRDV